MKITVAIIITTTALLSASPASAFSWQEFWTGHSTPEDSSLNQACRTLQIGFLAAAPCMVRQLRLTQSTPLHLQLADHIVVLANRVKAGAMTEKQANQEYEEDRETINRALRKRRNASMLQDFSSSMQRQLEIENAVKGAMHPNCWRWGVC